ncbi:DUF2267 domain-containing protein [Streptomyces sp. SM14]|uniref:DUF2267 domain-containing protein n=1 Tax=Streptomyces sp. SM14 TaxID=1736045 RepID=UPI000CD58ADA|nr:DUF2267 domain-containing protein [Streptomyces sp. SM14]
MPVKHSRSLAQPTAAVSGAAATAAVSAADDTGAFGHFLEQVRYEGAYPTRERAEEAVRHVLAALGGQIGGAERADLAACLPGPAARLLTRARPAAQPLSGWEFVQELTARTGGSPATTRWEVGAVLHVVARGAGRELLDRVLRSLPTGYALLFGRSELVGRDDLASAA